LQISIILTLGAVLVKSVYFSEVFEFSQRTKILLGALVFVCLMMIPRYFYLRGEGSIWWAPVVLEILVAHVFMFLQMGIDFFSWNNRKIKWQKELMFHQQFSKQPDVSETLLQKHINMLSLNPNTEAPQEDEDESKGKTIKIDSNFYSCTYFALMKVNKVQFKLEEAD
jgi:hypothetical protein